MNDSGRQNRRQYPRIKLSVPIEIQSEASRSPIRCATADISLCGCYVENMYPLPVGTSLDLQLSIGTTVLVAATVASCDPQVGNGIQFVRMLSEDREALKAFLDAAEKEQKSTLTPSASRR